MSTTPVVSIIIVTDNDEAWIGDSIESCLSQTLQAVEIICVDAGSRDETSHIVQSYRARDARVRILEGRPTANFLHLRKAGVASAAAPHVMFLESGHILAPSAAEHAAELARTSGAEVVALGIDLIVAGNESAPAPQESLQPQHELLAGADILASVFPAGRPARGHVWGHLFDTDFVRTVFDELPGDLFLARTDGLPIMYICTLTASTYASTQARLYRWVVRADRVIREICSLEDLELAYAPYRSIDQIEGFVREISARHNAAEAVLRETHSSAKLSVLGDVLRLCAAISDDGLRDQCLSTLRRYVSDADLVRAAAGFCSEALSFIASASHEPLPVSRPVRKVLLRTADLATGGVQGVVISQAKYLVEAGMDVTIAVHRELDSVHDIPAGVRVVRVEGPTRADRVAAWIGICKEAGADVIVDHHVLYDRQWPFYALAARAIGVPTLGCLQSFALRPLRDDNDNTTFLVSHLPLLNTVVTLSPTDVAFWKLRGIANVVHVPNPPSPMVTTLPRRVEPRTLRPGRIKLVWWGRLQQSTKQVRDLIPLTASLRQRGVEASITIIGPDTSDLTAARLRSDAEAHGIAAVVDLPGALHGDDLVRALSDGDLFVSTSVIEGSPLVLVEAQALGLPVAMYELPWLSNLVGNEGVISSKQGDVVSLARQIAALSRDPRAYGEMSRAALVAAQRTTSIDFPGLYRSLLDGTLPETCSPDPSLADARLLLEWTAFYAERNARHHGRQRRALTALREERAAQRDSVVRADREASLQRQRADDLRGELEISRAEVAQLRAENAARGRRRSAVRTFLKRLRPRP
jgi:glycosyltransferase involved in cell wall biosynthesis